LTRLSIIFLGKVSISYRILPKTFPGPALYPLFGRKYFRKGEKSKVFALAGFYKRALSEKMIPHGQLLSLVLYVDELVKNFFYFGGSYVATMKYVEAELISKYKRKKTRKHNKTTTDWKPTLTLIEKLYTTGVYADCKTFENLVDTTSANIFLSNQQRSEGEKNCTNTLGTRFGECLSKFMILRQIIISNH